jgi:hypothetical protein
MAFLASIISNFLLSLFTKLTEVFSKYLVKRNEKNKSDQTADEAKKKMDNAKTGKEIDDAADDTLGGI